jgi:DNA adenine methylase
MIYMGGKSRIAKQIIEVMEPYRQGRLWVEPFVGGGNVIQRVCGARLGCDSNPWAIHALRSIRDHAGDLPRNNLEFTEQDYRALRKSDDYQHKGFAGFTYSFGAKWLGGWARNRRGSDYVRRAFDSAQRQSPLLAGVSLVCCGYDELRISVPSLVYCDPPYRGTTGYSSQSFDPSAFDDWCAEMTNDGHLVFVSEVTELGSRFEVVWERQIANNLKSEKRLNEKLFLCKG